MTFIYDLDPYLLTRWLKINFVSQGFQKLSYYIHTDKQPPKTVPQRFADCDKNDIDNTQDNVCVFCHHNKVIARVQPVDSAWIHALL